MKPVVPIKLLATRTPNLVAWGGWITFIRRRDLQVDPPVRPDALRIGCVERHPVRTRERQVLDGRRPRLRAPGSAGHRKSVVMNGDWPLRRSAMMCVGVGLIKERERSRNRSICALPRLACDQVLGDDARLRGGPG